LNGIVLVALVATTVAMTPRAAEAAVRLRGKPILGRMSHAPTELAALRGAITSWRTKAARLGRPFTSWRLATRKRYECGQLTNGNFVCVVFAVPCRMVQRQPSARRPPSRSKIAPLPLPRIKPRPPKDANREI
jgi:hypothetical protein